MRTSTVAEVLDQVVASLRASLGENVHSCILYGSAVRGGLVPNVSDINLIVILNESTPEAHLAIARAIPSKSRIDPFVLGRIGLNRSMRAFASKISKCSAQLSRSLRGRPNAGFQHRSIARAVPL
jgi:predicted nucleotidyltransferase